MSDQFIGEVRPFACNFAPSGWAFCQGQLLSISQNTALFSLLGTNYGGNGISNFALPDLRGRVPMHYGTDPVGNVYSIGEIAGTETITLNGSQMPAHTHNVFGSSQVGGNYQVATTGSAMAADRQVNCYAPGNSSLTPINPGTVQIYNGGNQAHENRQPYQVINWCIALRGIFPSRN